MLKKLFIALFLAFSLGLLMPKGECSTEFITTYEVYNDTAQEAITYISTSTIVPNRSEIFGWTVSPTRKTIFSSYVSVWDLKSTSAWDRSSLLGETESPADSTQDKMFPRPRMIKNQVKVILGPYSSINIEYSTR